MSNSVNILPDIISRNIREVLNKLDINTEAASEDDLEITKLMVSMCGYGVSAQQIMYIYQFITEKNKYSRYLAEMYNKHRSNMGKILNKNKDELINNIVNKRIDTREKIYEILERYIAKMFVSDITNRLDNRIRYMKNILRIAMNTNTFKEIKDSILSTVTEITEHECCGYSSKLVRPPTNYANAEYDVHAAKVLARIYRILINNYTKISFKTLESDDSYVEETYSILVSIKNKNMRTRLRKLAIIGGIDSEEYSDTIFTELITATFFIYISIGKKYMPDVSNGQLKSMINRLEENGFESEEFKRQVSKIKANMHREDVVRIKKRYIYIKRSNLTDDELVLKSNVELADINYRLKMQAENI